MHPLHDYVAKQLADKLKSRRVVVWYDELGEFTPFIEEVRGGERASIEPVAVSVGGASARLAEYAGSMFEVRAAVEPHVSGDSPEQVLVYIAGRTRDRRASVLMELEKAGECYEPQLKRIARHALEKRFTPGVIDDLLNREKVAYEDIVRALSGGSGSQPPSVLKSVFAGVSGTDALLATWLMKDAHDADILEKEAVVELVKLVRSRLGLELAPDVSLAKLRAITLRYVLCSEFRADLRSAPPASLDGVPSPSTKADEAAVRAIATRLRADHATAYPAAADRVEQELGLRGAPLAADALGAIDTFRFEERALLRHCAALIAAAKYDEALQIIAQRDDSFWLAQNLERKAQWAACRLMAELGSTAVRVRAAVETATGGPDAWVAAYTSQAGDDDGGWYRLDQAQRRLEAVVANLEEPPEERPLAAVRRAYEDTCHVMARKFTDALVASKWATAGAVHQTRIFSEVVAGRPKPVAYFFVDAMRFEMGVELAERLPKTVEVSVRPALCALPSITPMGMAALLPGASASYSVVERGGRLGALIDDTFLPDLTSRKKFAAARVPNLVDFALDDLLSAQPSKLAKKLEGAQVVVVRSQEIDHAGETGFTRQARRTMDHVIGDIAKAIQMLANMGVEHSVVSADHGHLFFASDRDESLRTDSPKGAAVELHRRCWIGRGGANPPGTVRVQATALGYESDLDFVFPSGAAVFRAGGDLAFYHGGTSLQEMVIPVLTVRLRGKDSGRVSSGMLTVSGVPEVVTNRIFSVTLHLREQLRLDLPAAGDRSVRPVLVSAGKEVGVAGVVVGAELDRVTGCVQVPAGKPITVGFMLADDTISAVRVVVQDPTTDAELYRSPTDIPVKLGV